MSKTLLMSDLTDKQRRDLTIAVCRLLHDGVSMSAIARRFNISYAQVRYIRLRLNRGDIKVDWSDYNCDFSVDYGDIDKQAAEYQKRVVKSDIDWANISIGPCLGVWRYDDD